MRSVGGDLTQVERGPLLDVVVAQGAVVVQLVTIVAECLLADGDSFLSLGHGFDIRNREGWIDFKRNKPVVTVL